jgi:crotonobetainyl-CoA:carnitine CoA-transferase CaiB-like acyl-CoA transferase
MSNRPLSGIRIVEGVHGPLAMIGRYLADLGAEVDRFAADSDDSAEGRAANAGKRVRGADLDDPAAKTAIETAHIVIADAASPLDLAALRRARPDLVTMTVSDFGTTGPLADWRASGPVLHALSAVLSRSGIRGREPLLPPGDLAYQCAAPQAAFALLGALYRALRGGTGAHFDFSALDGAVQGLDPGFGINGSATMGKPVGLLMRDRPRAGFQYPILRCADGNVRICLLAKRQWRGMFKWMGEPEQFAAPEFDRTSHRYASPDLLPFIGAFFANRRRADLEREGQEYGVPIASVLTLGEFLDSDHAIARDAVLTQPDGTKLPNGVLTIDGERMGPLENPESAAFPPAGDAPPAPFGDLKVLDLGVIVVGAEGARLLGDLGADVVKIESQARRQPPILSRFRHVGQLRRRTPQQTQPGHRPAQRRRARPIPRPRPPGRCRLFELQARHDGQIGSRRSRATRRQSRHCCVRKLGFRRYRAVERADGLWAAGPRIDRP